VTHNEQDDVARYAAAIRAALADLPEAARAELLEDLEDHLREVLAETGGSPVERFGPPETYAAELRSSAGLADSPSRRSRLSTALRRSTPVRAALGGYAAAGWLAGRLSRVGCVGWSWSATSHLRCSRW